MPRPAGRHALRERPSPVIESAYLRAGVMCCDLEEWTAWYVAARGVQSRAQGGQEAFCDDGEQGWCESMRKEGRCRKVLV